VELEDDLEGKLNLEANLDRSRIEAVATTLRLIEAKERKLDTLNAQLMCSLKFERDDYQEKIEKLERENRSLKHHSSTAAYYRDRQHPVNPEKIAELEAKTRALKEDLTGAKLCHREITEGCRQKPKTGRGIQHLQNFPA
jgi:hypothetical protein